ncbi:hypothetical protein ElyMa_004742300 [Elysia marginata]|uniref:Uncharacterized protein n=1 Tax=Elysia marginata TaxID=1093978 RepID=A0AAV4IGW0_9GAST|nr:hypothetical protein ElyMa_004742300 [Elysia marginata]
MIEQRERSDCLFKVSPYRSLLSTVSIPIVLGIVHAEGDDGIAISVLGPPASIATVKGRAGCTGIGWRLREMVFWESGSASVYGTTMVYETWIHLTVMNGDIGGVASGRSIYDFVRDRVSEYCV